MTVSNVDSVWTNGNLVFRDKAAATLFTIDGNAATLTFAKPVTMSDTVTFSGTVNMAPSAMAVEATAATLAITAAAHAGKTIVLNRAAGIAVTLPAATGTLAVYKFVVGTTITSNTTTIKVTGNDVMYGRAIQSADGGDTVVVYDTAADSDTITLDGSTKGGIIGDTIELIDVGTDKWTVTVIESATGAEATPFSATVS